MNAEDTRITTCVSASKWGKSVSTTTTNAVSKNPITHRTQIRGCFLVPRTQKMLAMENVKIQGLSELSLDLRPSSVIFSWEISALLTEWNCSRRVSMKHLIFFPVSLWTFDCLRRDNWNDSHIFIFVISYSLYTKHTFNIFKERNKNVKKVLMYRNRFKCKFSHS